MNMTLAELNDKAAKNGWDPKNVTVLVTEDAQEKIISIGTIVHPDMEDCGWIVMRI